MVTKAKRVGWRDWMPSWKSLGKIVLYVAVLYAFQALIAVPLTAYLLGSDYFTSAEVVEPSEAKQAAQDQCHGYLQQKLAVEQVEFPFEEDKVWEIGDGRYLVKASALVTGQDTLAHRVNYACYVKYQGGDVFDAANWKLRGLDWLMAEQTQ
ncbi:MAG: hypothetical protein N3A55_07355 [Methylohalobius sp.]|nr:hypothetical protein [Methylohalobius sp.]